MTDQTTDPVQPEDGQGGGGQEAPYAEYLQRIPEEARSAAEEAFKAWDADTTRKFQEHAEFRKGWEPLQNTGINQFSPEQVEWATQFLTALEQPQTIQQWYEQYAAQNGLTVQQAQQQAAPPAADEFGMFDPAALEQVLKGELAPLRQQLEAMNSWREQQEQTARVAEAQRFVDGQIEELKAKHPDEFNEAAIEKLVVQYIDTDPRNAVQRAFSDWQAIRSQIEKDTLQSKVNQPPPAEGGGMANGAPEEVKTLAQAGEIARQRIRDSREA